MRWFLFSIREPIYGKVNDIECIAGSRKDHNYVASMTMSYASVAYKRHGRYVSLLYVKWIENTSLSYWFWVDITHVILFKTTCRLNNNRSFVLTEKVSNILNQIKEQNWLDCISNYNIDEYPSILSWIQIDSFEDI